MAFQNSNVCRNKIKAGASDSAYSQLDSEECSEVIILGPAGGVYIADGGGVRDPQAANSFLLPAGDYFTFRGLTNSDQLSAKQVSGTPTIYYRTQFYGTMTQR